MQEVSYMANSDIININIPKTVFGIGAVNQIGAVARGFSPEVDT